MNKNTQNKPRHWFAQFLMVLFTIEILMVFALAFFKAKFPFFYALIRDVAFWDIMAIIITVVIYAIAFPNDLKEQKENKEK